MEKSPTDGNATNNNNDEDLTIMVKTLPTSSATMAVAMPEIGEMDTAFSHIPEHGFSLFLAKRTKIIHFVRHAEGFHNQANHEYGDDTPNVFSTPGSWKYQDARLTKKGIEQCVHVRKNLLHGVHPQIVIVSPFTRTLQTAHILFGGGGQQQEPQQAGQVPFMVHHLCRERAGKYTCDKLRSKTEIIADMKPIYDHTHDHIDFDSYGFASEQDELWTENRESPESVIQRGIEMLKWLATRPETEMAVVTHSSWLKHLFHAFVGDTIDEKDQETMHRLAGNAEIRSICLALHKGFYPPGEWIVPQGKDRDGTFIPHDPTFRRGKWAPTIEHIANTHMQLQPSSFPEEEDEEKKAKKPKQEK